MRGSDGSDAALGIDFGTSTTLAAVRDGATSRTVALGRGADTWMPSLVGLGSDGHVVGEACHSLPIDEVIRSPKTGITDDRTVLEAPNGLTIATEEAVHAVLTETLRRLRANGIEPADRRIHLGCPAMWQREQREQLVHIARDCGLSLTVGDVIDEPIAAGVAWIRGRRRSEATPNSKVLVFDPGGGTLDVALLQTRESGGDPEITVLAANGTNKSGDALDESIAIDLWSRHDLGERTPALDALVANRARELKEGLSFEERLAVALGGGGDTVLRYTRDQLEAAFDTQLTKAIGLVESVLRSGKLREEQTLTTAQIRGLPIEDLVADVGHVVLVGGLSQVPAVRVALEHLVPGARIDQVTDPQQAIVRGLVFADEFDRLNLHRPGFDFWITYRDRSGRSLPEAEPAYPAFTPLYQPHHTVLSQTALGYQPTLRKPPRAAVEAALECRSVEGQPIPLTVDSQRVPNITARVDAMGPPPFKLYVNGDVLFGSQRFRVSSWPTLRGAHHNWSIGLVSAPVHREYIPPSAVYARSTRAR